MSINEVRRYARQIAAELVEAGVRKESLIDANGVEQMWGWPVWGQVLRMEVHKYTHDPVAYEQSDRTEIWLRPDGTLMEAQLVVNKWPGTSPDHLEKVTETSDHCIRWADVAFNQRCSPPTVPPGRHGLFEDAITMRAGVKIPDPPGSVVLEGFQHLANTSQRGRSTELCVEARNRAHITLQKAAENAPRPWKARAITRWSFSLAVFGVLVAALVALSANGSWFSGRPGFTTSFLLAIIGWGLFQAAITWSVSSQAESNSELDSGLRTAAGWGCASATFVTFLLVSSSSQGAIPSTAWLLTWVLVATGVGLLASRWAFRAGRT